MTPSSPQRPLSLGPVIAEPSARQALDSLLRVRGTDEMEKAVVELVRSSTGAEWVALYREGEGGWLQRAGFSGAARPSAGRPGGPAIEPLPAGDAFPSRWTGALPQGLPEDAVTAAPLDTGNGSVALLVLGPSRDGAPYGPGALAGLLQVAQWCSVALQNSLAFDQLRSQVFVDALTGCHNRRAFDEHLHVEVLRARRYRRPLSLLLLDIDHFKWINDGLGHQAGDHVLRRLGALLLDSFRTTDRVCRYGGDEFAVVFPETPKEEALRLAERLRLEVASLFPDADLSRGITASLGIAACPGDAVEVDDLLRAADRALHQAKACGKNRVVAS